MVDIPSSIADDYRFLTRGIAEIVPEDGLVQKLLLAKKENRPLRVKWGYDPTAPHVTLGWTVNLRVLRRFQELGHEVLLLQGDFTASIGDPSGKSKTRPQLTREQIAANSREYESQFAKVLDLDRVTRVHNGEWADKMSFRDVVELASRYTVARLVERDDFSKRLASGTPISVHELLYPLLQGYDSVMLRSDIELGATEQKFNCLVGRDLQAQYGQPQQALLLMPILIGTDGKDKMSQSLGNYIGITEEPREMFGKVMSIPDAIIADYFLLLTDVPEPRIAEWVAAMAGGSANPRDIKANLAKTLVAQYHDAAAAENAEQEFDRMFQQGGLPDDIPEFQVAPGDGNTQIAQILLDAGLVKSKGEARRLIQQNALTVDGEKITDTEAALTGKGEFLVKAGKRRFLKVRV